MMNAESLPAVFNDSAAGWEHALYAFSSEEGTPFRIPPHPGELLPNGPALLPEAGEDTGAGHQPGRVRVRSRARPKHRTTRAGSSSRKSSSTCGPTLSRCARRPSSSHCSNSDDPFTSAQSRQSHIHRYPPVRKLQSCVLDAARSRSFNSCTATSGKPTILNAPNQREISASTATVTPPRPTSAQLLTRASMEMF